MDDSLSKIATTSKNWLSADSYLLFSLGNQKALQLLLNVIKQFFFKHEQCEKRHVDKPAVKWLISFLSKVSK